MIVLEPPRDVLLRHVIERRRSVPGFVRQPGTFREIGRSGDGRGAVNWRKKTQIASCIVHGSSPDRDSVQSVMEPDPLIDHEAEEVWRRLGGCTAPATDAA